MTWRAALLCCAVFMLLPGRGECQISQISRLVQTNGSAALLSDYRFRGESLSGGRAALQGTINFDLQGLYFGALASQASAHGTGFGTQAYAGFAQAINSRVSWEIGAVRYSYSSSEGAPKYEYTDLFAGAATDSFGVRLYASNNYLGIGTRAYYAEASANEAFGTNARWFAKLGYLYRSHGRQMLLYGAAPSVMDFKIGCAVTVTALRELTFEIAVSGTNVGNNRCAAYSTHCTPALTAAVIKGF